MSDNLEKKIHYRFYILLLVFLLLLSQIITNPPKLISAEQIDITLGNKAKQYKMYDISNFFYKKAKTHNERITFIDLNIGYNLYEKAKDINVPSRREISLKRLELKQSKLPQSWQIDNIRAIKRAEKKLNQKTAILNEAIGYFQSEIDNITGETLSSVLGIADCYALLGDTEKAAEYYEKSLKIKPNDLYIIYQLVVMYKNTVGKEGQALKYIEKYLALKPNYINMYFDKGWVLDDLKRYNESIEAYKIYFAEYPKSSAACSNMIYIYIRNNDYENAEIMLNKCSELMDNEDEDFLINSAEILAHKGKYMEAKELAQKVLDKDENYGYMVYPIYAAIDLSLNNVESAEDNFKKAYDNAKFYYDTYCFNSIYEPNDYEAHCYNRKVLIDDFENVKKRYYSSFK